MNHSNEEVKYVCPKCIKESYLSTLINETGRTEAECSYCDNDDQPCFLIDEVVDIIHPIIQNQFYRTSDEPDGYDCVMLNELDRTWEREGISVCDLIEEILETREDIAADLLNALANKHHEISKTGDFQEEQAYDDEAQYSPKSPDGGHIKKQWNDLKIDLLSKARFFSPKAEITLNIMFHDIGILRTRDDVPVIKTLNAGHEQKIFRARVSYSDDDLKKILSSPVRELAAPPSHVTPSGRMNANGIVCFYGAEDVDTCISEIRPPVGSQVVVGEFEIIRDIRLLDFDLLTKVYAPGSPFAPNYTDTWQKAKFFKYLIAELIKPVMPGTEDTEYLPTQYLADYLANKDGLNIDGIIFHSSQTGRPAKNVVLFNKSCKVEEYDIPLRTKIDVCFFCGIPDEDPDEITIYEQLPPPSTNEEKHQYKIIPDFYNLQKEETVTFQPDTLRLNIHEIKVCRISAASYNPVYRTVNRSRPEYNPKRIWR